MWLPRFLCVCVFMKESMSVQVSCLDIYCPHDRHLKGKL